MHKLETPSRVWRRIVQDEARDDELPSLPSVSELDEGGSEIPSASRILPPPIQSTPTSTTGVSSYAHKQTSSQTRFANSLLTSRSTTRGSAVARDDGSFEISRISHSGDEIALGTELSVHLSLPGTPFGKDGSKLSPAVYEGSGSQRKSSTLATNTDESMRRSPSPASTPSLSRSIASSSSATSSRNAESLNDMAVSERSSSRRQSLSSPVQLGSTRPETPAGIPIMHERSPSRDTPSSSPPPHALDATPRPDPAAPRTSITVATPSMLRRDFIMAIVDSNPRPRFAVPTPHPVRSLATPAGRTPHPLSQVYTAGNTSGEMETGDVSTASSHDLTVHRRANASFDPTTTRGAAGLARFDTQKLNVYLHALNKRLTEENRMLNERLGLASPTSMAYEKSRSLLERIDQSRDEEQLASETFINNMMEDLAEAEREKDRTSKELEEERKLRARDSDMYKERLADVEHGVRQIIQGLEDRLADADEEAKRARRTLEVVEADCDAQKARAERAERLLTAHEDGMLAESSELSNAQDRIAELTNELADTRRELGRVEGRLSSAQQDMESTKVQVRVLERKLRDVEDEGLGKDQDLRISKSMAMDLQKQVEELSSKLEKAQDEYDIAGERIKDLEHDYTETFKEAERLRMQNDTISEAARQSEAALEEAERQMTDDAATISSLQRQLSTLQRDLQEASRRGIDVSVGRSTVNMSIADEDAATLRGDLEAANAEIGRLKYLYGQTPVRNAIAKAKDARLEELERKNEALEEELSELHRLVVGANSISKGNITIGKPDTPLAFRQTVQRINNLVRTPKTPGVPMRDPSWTISTPGNAGQDSLLANIAHIRKQLYRAEADLGIVNAEDDDRWGMAQINAEDRLNDAKSHIADLQAELVTLRRKVEETPAECVKCRDQRTRDGNRTFEAVTQNQAANSRQRPSRRAANINVSKPSDDELQAMHKEYAASQARIEAELRKARDTVSSLEHELEGERDRLSTLATEQARVTDERDKAIRQLQRTKEGMEDVKNQLNLIKQENQTLEAQVLRNAERGQRFASLETKLSENQRTIETLRTDRESLLKEHDQMHQRYQATTDRLQQLRDEHSTALTSQEKTQRQIDQQAREIASLKAALNKQTAQLEDAQTRHERMNADRDEQLAELAHDLKNVRQEANAVGRQLEVLRQEKEMLYVKRNQSTLNAQRQHSLEREIGDIKARHNAECKGLFLQIQYLKAKFTRESTMRDSLSYQKGYLLILLACFERRENKIVASIARVGFPNHVQHRAQEQTTARRLLRGAVLVTIFVNRAKKAALAWKQECALRPAIQDALQDVRRRRVGVIDT